MVAFARVIASYSVAKVSKPSTGPIYRGKPLAGAGQSFAMATLREGAYAAPACRDRACADRAIGEKPALA
jgi:hypothetical protein